MASNRVWAGVALVALFVGVSDAIGPHCDAVAAGAWTAASTWTCTPAGTKVPGAQTTVAIAGYNVTLAFTATNPTYESMEITVSNKGALILQAPPPGANGQCGVNSLNAVADFKTGGMFIMNSCTNFTGALTFDVATFLIDGTLGPVSVYSPALSVLGSKMTAKGMYRIDGRNGQFSVKHKGKVFSELTLTSSGWKKNETASGLTGYSTGQVVGYMDGIDLSNVHLSVILPDNLEMKGGVSMHSSGLKGTGNVNLVIKQYDGSQPIVKLDVGSTLAVDNVKIQSEDDSQIWAHPIPVVACTTNDGACIHGDGGSSLEAVTVQLAYLGLNPSPSKDARILLFNTDVQVGTIQAAFTVATAPTHYAYPVISVPSCSRVQKVVGEPLIPGLDNIYMTYKIAQFHQDAENPVPSFTGKVNLDIDYSAIMDKISDKRYGWTRIGYNSKSQHPKLTVTCQTVILSQIYIYGTGSVFVFRGEAPTGEMHIGEVYFGVSEVQKMITATPTFIYGNEKNIVTIQKIGFVYGNVYPNSPPNPPPHPVTIDATIHADYLFETGAGDIFVKPLINAHLGITLWEQTKAQVPNLDIDKDSKLSIGFSQTSACKDNVACTLWFSSQADITGHLMLTNATILMPPIEDGAVHFNLFGDASKLTLGGEVHVARTTPMKQWPTVGFSGVANTLAIDPSSGMLAPDILVSHRSSHGTVQTSHIIEPYPLGGGRARLALGRIHMANYGVGTVTLSGEAQAYQIADVGSNFLNSRLNILVGSQQRAGNINVVINGILLSGKGLVAVNGWGAKKTSLTIPRQITASMLVNGATVNTDIYTGGFTLVGKNAIMDLQSCDLKSMNKSIYLTWDGLSTFSADTASTLSPPSLFFKSTSTSSNGNVQIWPMTKTGTADCANPSTTKTGVAYDITKFAGKGLVSRPNTAPCPKKALLPPMGAPYPPSPAEVPYNPYAPPDVPIPPQPTPGTTPGTPGSTSAPKPPKAGKKDDSGMGSGGVAGIIIGVLVVIAIAAAAAYFFVVKKGRGDFKSIE